MTLARWPFHRITPSAAWILVFTPRWDHSSQFVFLNKLLENKSPPAGFLCFQAAFLRQLLEHSVAFRTFFFKIGYCLNVCTYVETSGICSSLLLIKLPHKHKILTLAHPFPGSCCLYSSLMSSCIVAPPSGRRKNSRKQSASTSLLPKPQGLQWWLLFCKPVCAFGSRTVKYQVQRLPLGPTSSCPSIPRITSFQVFFWMVLRFSNKTQPQLENIPWCPTEADF